MSQAADLADATETPSSVGDPSADWGGTAADWLELKLQEIGSDATLKIDPTPNPNLVQLTFANVASVQKTPGSDGAYTGELDFTSKLVRVPPLPARVLFFVDAKPKVAGVKVVASTWRARPAPRNRTPTGPPRGSRRSGVRPAPASDAVTSRRAPAPKDCHRAAARPRAWPRGQPRRPRPNAVRRGRGRSAAGGVVCWRPASASSLRGAPTRRPAA